MKVSLDWLTTWLPLTEAQASDPQKVSDILTASGLEVEGLEEMPVVPGGLKGMVVGEVLTCEPHPNADRLRVTTVDVGDADALVHRVWRPQCRRRPEGGGGHHGATCHPTEGDPFKIKKGKIRGEVSMGMICAEDELGIGTSHDGILVLDGPLENGLPAAVALGLESDHCIEIGLTPNRTDAMGHRGVARDLRAAWKWNGGDGQGADVQDLLAPPALSVDPDSGPISIDIQDADGAPIYLGVTLSGIQVGPSPDWMQQRLRTIGIEPKNNVVDITNYVLHDLGQPLHAFDADRIAGNVVRVRRAQSGEAFTTLEGKTLELSEADLVIADADRPMCLAGIFGGADSGVTEATTRVFLESAWFEPVTVRKSAKRHTLSTDASFRFERGIDPKTAGPGLQKAVDLLVAHAGATVEGGLQRAEGTPPSTAEVRMEWAAMDQWIGISLDRDRVRGILSDLDIAIREEDAEGMRLEVPAYRRDVTRPADVVEEVLRIHGYDHIPLPGRMKVSLSDRPNPDPEQLRTEWAGILVARGFHETMHNSLVPAGHLSLVEDDALHPDRAVTLLNPLSSELDTLRQTLIFRGLTPLHGTATTSGPTSPSSNSARSTGRENKAAMRRKSASPVRHRPDRVRSWQGRARTACPSSKAPWMPSSPAAAWAMPAAAPWPGPLFREGLEPVREGRILGPRRPDPSGRGPRLRRRRRRVLRGPAHVGAAPRRVPHAHLPRPTCPGSRGCGAT